MGLKKREIFPVPCTRDSANKTFGPTDLTRTYSVFTRRVFGGTGTEPRPSGLESNALTTGLPKVPYGFSSRRNHQMALIERHNDESVREGCIRNGGKEVKLFTSVLKAFQCNKRIVMAQRKHLEVFYVVELLDDWNVDAPSWKYLINLESPRVSSPGFENDSKMMVM
ncbi:uncharacterized protein TNCV_4161201 [Trichonephila clavipes]|nr:uncharacterized protein TNCV_4161201 [Trichonephila clavipes]